jgi:hypothetical protein
MKTNKMSDNKSVSKMTIKDQQEDLEVAIKEKPHITKSGT